MIPWSNTGVTSRTDVMMSSLITIVTLASISGFVETKATFNTQQKYLNSQVRDKQFTQFVLFESHAQTAVKCAGLCTRHEDCVSFTLCGHQGRCRGYSQRMTSDMPHSVVVGTALFAQQTSDTDECLSSPCQNGGSCIDDVNSYTCVCAAGYSGVNCDREIDECASNPCENGGVCKNQVNGYLCQCEDGYTGSQCQTDIDECVSAPCQNGGTCVDQVNSYMCQCVTGYTGQQCQTDITECASKPCQNGGTCHDDVNSYTCLCASGYSGVNCNEDIDECESDPCQHGGVCENQVNGYLCQCAPGYTGPQCQTDTDECVSAPCQNGGTCVDQINGYLCQCAPGFTGPRCKTATANSWLETTCTANTDCPADNSECFAGQCLCTPGYYYSLSQTTCIPICTALNVTYIRYDDRDLSGQFRESIDYVADISPCITACNADPYCRVIVFDNDGGNPDGRFCFLKDFTPLDNSPGWRAETGIEVFQRTCT